MPLACDASSLEMKNALQQLGTIGLLDVERSDATAVGGHTWTISFVEDLARTHRGDMQELSIHSNLTGGSGKTPTITVEEGRKGTIKEVQKISISTSSASVDPTSSFKLRFQGQTTGDILALPINGTTCLGSTAAKQIITTSTEDTSTEGGDNTVSPHTIFVIWHDGFRTSPIAANNGTCEDTASVIAHELTKLPPLQSVAASGQSSSAGDEGCVWEITLLSVIGNPDLLQGSSSRTSKAIIFLVMKLISLFVPLFSQRYCTFAIKHSSAVYEFSGRTIFFSGKF